MHSAAPSTSDADWIGELCRFLEVEPAIAAVRLDAADRTVAVATLGPVDQSRLEARIQEVLRAIDLRLGAPSEAIPPLAPVGFVVTREGAVTTVERPACATAPRFYRWQEYALPAVEPEGTPEPEQSEWRPLAALAGTCGAAGALALLAGRLGAPGWLEHGLYGLALSAGGWDAALDSWAHLRRRRLDIHFLMLAVAFGAVAVGAWGEAVLLLFLFSGAGAMEAYATERTRREVSSLLHSAPKQATRVGSDGRHEVVAVDALRVGDRLVVKPGEAFAADGEVARGESACDESNLTGESLPVDKTIGATVFSGTLNLWGVLEVDVRRLPAESTLQRIIRLIHTAQRLKAPSQRLTDRFGGRYTEGALAVTGVMFLVWWLGFGLPPFQGVDGQASAFYRAMTLLVVASPCALVLSIPSAILAAIAWGARHGVLFRGGAAIEKLAEVDTVALDKTGTLTTGELAVTAVESFPPGRESEVLGLAYALERNSQHPIARAITGHARRLEVEPQQVERFESITGQGVRAVVDGTAVVLGRRELVAAGPFAGWLERVAPAAPDSSEVWVVGRGLVGRLLLRDQLRPESRATLAWLRSSGLRSVMLTGDRRHAAEAVARELGLDDVRSGLSPGQKVQVIAALGAAGRRVAMVGDGVNDAPSLAAAHVAVAMGARGSDAALEQAEVVLMHDRIENFAAAFRLSRRARRVIRQNLVVSLGTVSVMVAIALLGEIPLSVGVIAHEGSTVLVCLNSLRLLFSRAG